MDEWRSLAEERIRQAMDEGKFDNLHGAGEPFHWDENPFLDEAERLGGSLLRSNGFDHPLIAERKEIDRVLDDLRQALRSAQRCCGNHPGLQTAWQDALTAFEADVASLNRRIRDYNLKVPHHALHLKAVDARAEILLITRQALPET